MQCFVICSCNICYLQLQTYWVNFESVLLNEGMSELGMLISLSMADLRSVTELGVFLYL